jgi:hypothetical protein
VIKFTSASKTGRDDIAKILLKVVLNTKNQLIGKKADHYVTKALKTIQFMNWSTGSLFLFFCVTKINAHNSR